MGIRSMHYCAEFPNMFRNVKHVCIIILSVRVPSDELIVGALTLVQLLEKILVIGISRKIKKNYNIQNDK